MVEKNKILTEKELMELDPSLEYTFLHTIKSSFPYEDLGEAYEGMLLRRYETIRMGYYAGSLEEEVSLFQQEMSIVISQRQALTSCINLVKTAENPLIVGAAQQIIETISDIPVKDYLDAEKDIAERITRLRKQSLQLEEELELTKSDPLVLKETEKEVETLKEEDPKTYQELKDSAVLALEKKIAGIRRDVQDLYNESSGIHRVIVGIILPFAGGSKAGILGRQRAHEEPKSSPCYIKQKHQFCGRALFKSDYTRRIRKPHREDV